MIAEQPLIGVVIPAYNGERWLAATVDSLRVQSWTDWTCVIVDDGSTDGTGEVAANAAAEDDRIHLISQQNAGLPMARNAGIAALDERCTFVAFLDADDLWEPEALTVLAQALLARPDAVGAYGLAEYIDANGTILNPGLHPARQRYRREIKGRRLRELPADADATFAVIVVYGPIWPPAVSLHWLAHVKAVGGFDATFPSQEDWDFYVRMSRRGPYVSLDRPLAFYRRHGSNMSGAHAFNILQQQHVRHNAFVSQDNSIKQAKQVARAWRYLEARQAAILGRQAARQLRARDFRSAGSLLLGSAVCASQLLRSGPPTPSMRHVRHTRPATLPGAGLL